MVKVVVEIQDWVEDIDIANVDNAVKYVKMALDYFQTQAKVSGYTVRKINNEDGSKL